MDTADQAGDVEQLARTAVILSEEVVGVKFEYLDGQLGAEPLTAWNSDDSKKLPRAIRVTLELRVKNSDGTTNPDAKAIIHTFVIAVPIADAKPSELEEFGF